MTKMHGLEMTMRTRESSRVAQAGWKEPQRFTMTIANDRQRPGAMPAEPALSGLYCGLMEADDQNDAGALARIGWILFAMASTAQQAQCETAGLLSELRAAARATAAGEGSPASLALLRHVLGKHGWLPPAGATPLQMLAAPR